MSLTNAERMHWLHVLEEFPESSNSPKAYTAAYKSHLEHVSRETVTLMGTSVGIPVTCYINKPNTQTSNAVYINLHGGGWFIPWNEDDLYYTARIADEVGCIVVDVDYAISPDYSYPVALEQVYAVLNWVASQCSDWHTAPTKIVVGGCSAGGNMAAAVCILSEIRGGVRPCMQILDCASLDKVTPPELKRGGQNYNIPLEKQHAWTELYFNGDKVIRSSPTASPVYADDDMLSRMPKALIITAGKDALRYEAEDYGRRLARNGVEVTIRNFPDSCHAFNTRLMDQWEDSQKFIINHLKAL